MREVVSQNLPWIALVAANDTELCSVRCLAQIPTSPSGWLYLYRHTDKETLYTVVPAPLDPRDDTRYLRLYEQRGWKPYLADPQGDELPFVENWDPLDPTASLARCLQELADLSPQDIAKRLRHFRYVAV